MSLNAAGHEAIPAEHRDITSIKQKENIKTEIPIVAAGELGKNSSKAALLLRVVEQ